MDISNSVIINWIRINTGSGVNEHSFPLSFSNTNYSIVHSLLGPIPSSGGVAVYDYSITIVSNAKYKIRSNANYSKAIIAIGY